MKTVLASIFSIALALPLAFTAQAAIQPSQGVIQTEIGTSGVDRHTCNKQERRGEVQSPFC